MRFVISAILGTLVVVAMLLAALYYFDTRINEASLRPVMEVERLPDRGQVDVAEWLQETRGDLPEVGEDGAPTMPPPRPPVEIAPREINGFVQVVFTVEPDGSVSDARVFGAVPPGYYEEQALERVRARRWDPGVDADGNIVAREATEVIEFTVPADAPRRTGTGDPGP